MLSAGGSPSWVQGNGTHSRGQPSIWEQSMRQQQQHALLHQQQQQGPPAPPASPGRQQAPEDTLAGDLEVLSQHLQTARICQQNKASMLTAVSPAGPAGASPPPSAAMQSTATGARSVQVRWLPRRPCSRLWDPGKQLTGDPFGHAMQTAVSSRQRMFWACGPFEARH